MIFSEKLELYSCNKLCMEIKTLILLGEKEFFLRHRRFNHIDFNMTKIDSC